MNESFDKEVYVLKLKSGVIRDAIQQSGYSMTDENPDAPIVFVDGNLSVDEFQQFKVTQRINKIPKMDEICFKSSLSIFLLQMKQLFPHYYCFFPETFLIPHQFNEFTKVHAKISCKSGAATTWIFKPRSGCCGNGIKLLQNPFCLINETTPGVVQRYIEPFLLGGFKFDFRIYLLVASLSPYSVYIYKEGLGRFCTKKYKGPNKSNLDNKFEHISNTAINIENKEANIEYTRLMRDVLKEIAKTDERGRNLWERIKTVCALTALSIYPQIVASITNIRKVTNKNKNQVMNQCFHILGIDILVDNNCNPIVLELNDRPSMKVSFACEHGLKLGLIKDAFNVVFQKDSKTRMNSGNLWEKIYPLAEESSTNNILRIIHQKSFALFGPKQSLMFLHSNKTIVYPKPPQDKVKVMFKPSSYL